MLAERLEAVKSNGNVMHTSRKEEQRHRWTKNLHRPMRAAGHPPAQPRPVSVLFPHIFAFHVAISRYPTHILKHRDTR